MRRSLSVFAFAACVASLSFAFVSQLSAQSRDYSPTRKELPKRIPSAISGKIDYGHLPVQLTSSSRAAFRQGLMPLEDHLSHLALARDARLSGTDPDDRDGQFQVWAEYRNQITSAMRDLERFGQPGAANWQTELSLARFSLARSQQQMAEISKNDIAMQQTASDLQVAASQFVSQRRTDYSIGWATQSDVTFAQLKQLGANGASGQDKIDLLSQSAHASTITRSDQLKEFAFVNHVVQFEMDLANGDLDVIRSQLARVQSAGHQHFNETARYYREGTAPLHQLTNSIVLRQKFRQLQSEFPELADETSDRQFLQDWSTLKAAASRSDQRGRNAADFHAVQLLAVGIDR